MRCRCCRSCFNETKDRSMEGDKRSKASMFMSRRNHKPAQRAINMNMMLSTLILFRASFFSLKKTRHRHTRGPCPNNGGPANLQFAMQPGVSIPVADDHFVLFSPYPPLRARLSKHRWTGRPSATTTVWSAQSIVCCLRCSPCHLREIVVAGTL